MTSTVLVTINTKIDKTVIPLSSSLVEKDKHIRKSRYNMICKVEICIRIDKARQKRGTKLMKVGS